MNEPLDVFQYSVAGAAIARDRRENVIEMPMRENPNGFQWRREDCLGLAAEKCVHCAGLGMKAGARFTKLEPCRCVLRRIFRICLNRYRDVQAMTLNESARVSRYLGGRRSNSWGYKGVEFCSDFLSLAQRALQSAEYETFRLHYIYGFDYRQCCRELRIDKGSFFHSIYRIEAKLGRQLRELQPYALFPLDEYFGGVRTKAKACKVIEMPKRRLSSQVPLRIAAAA